jgi:hypothetical protein
MPVANVVDAADHSSTGAGRARTQLHRDLQPPRAGPLLDRVELGVEVIGLAIRPPDLVDWHGLDPGVVAPSMRHHRVSSNSPGKALPCEPRPYLCSQPCRKALKAAVWGPGLVEHVLAHHHEIPLHAQCTRPQIGYQGRAATGLRAGFLPVHLDRGQMGCNSSSLARQVSSIRLIRRQNLYNQSDTPFWKE